MLSGHTRLELAQDWAVLIPLYSVTAILNQHTLLLKFTLASLVLRDPESREVSMCWFISAISGKAGCSCRWGWRSASCCRTFFKNSKNSFTWGQLGFWVFLSCWFFSYLFMEPILAVAWLTLLSYPVLINCSNWLVKVIVKVNYFFQGFYIIPRSHLKYF